jgi:glycosyltransferase involved in cell wall biosynthesis
MKIFHLTYWYSNKRNLHEALWIRSHVDSLKIHVKDQFVFHFQVNVGKHFSLSRERQHKNHSSLIFSGPMPWWLIEILAFIGVAFLMLVKARKYDVVNVHIAYPSMTYFHLIRKWVNRPVVITEHWSAYHFNFGVKKRLRRIQRIFRNNLPLITVSNSLLLDVKNFSQENISTSCVIPNSVDEEIFCKGETVSYNPATYFMLSQWKWPKKPDIVIRAFSRLIQISEYQNFKLRIGGYGAQLNDIETLIDEMAIRNNVVLLGSLSSYAVAREMNECSAFLHASEYETFSVVCAEAICCGAPVIASAVGGIPEFIHSENGILVENNTPEGWLSAFKKFNHSLYDRTEISRSARNRFSLQTVGKRYVNFLSAINGTYK